VTEQCKKLKQRRPGVPPGHLRPESPVIFSGIRSLGLNEQVKRSSGRFPADFGFQLSRAERDEVVANCDHLRRPRFSSTMPFAVTE